MREQIREIAKVIADALKPVDDRSVRLMVIPKNVKRFPDKKIGDRIYLCHDLSEGVSEFVVLWKTDDDICVVIEIGVDVKYGRRCYPDVGYATDCFHSSLKEVTQELALFDLTYYEKAMARTKQAINLINASKDDNLLVQQLNDLTEGK